MKKKPEEHVSELLTAGQLAERWRISVVTLWRWRKKQAEMGEPFPAVEIGGELRFNPEEVNAFVDKCKVMDPILRHCKAS